MRTETSWITQELGAPEIVERARHLLYRPVAIRHGADTCLRVLDQDRSGPAGLLTSIRTDRLGIWIGSRPVPIQRNQVVEGGPAKRPPIPLGGPGHGGGLPVTGLGDWVFVRICECLHEYLLAPAILELGEEERRVLSRAGGQIIERSSGLYVWIPVKGPDDRVIEVQEFPDTLGLIIRELDDSGKEVSRVMALPNHDWAVGELFERSSRAHLERVAEHRIGTKALPVTQFLTQPTARMERAVVVTGHRGREALEWTHSISSPMLPYARLLGFSAGREFQEPPRTGEILATHGERLVVLDQGGARGPVVCTEPKKWGPLPDKSALVIRNGLKYLTTIMVNGSTYHMRSEALEEFRKDEWKRKGEFTLNDLVFAGDHPRLKVGDLATFAYESGKPERVRTGLGEAIYTVSEPQTRTIQVYITHAREEEGRGLYLDGYRSTGSLTALEAEGIQAEEEVRGGRKRWRPRPITLAKILRDGRRGRLPLVIRTRSGETHVVARLLPSAVVVAPEQSAESGDRDQQDRDRDPDPQRDVYAEKGRDKGEGGGHKKQKKMRSSWGPWGGSGTR